MLALQGALTAQAFYPPGHHIQSCQEHAYKMMQQILERQQKIDIFMLNDRVIFDDKTLPSSVNLINGLFGLLYHNGADRITFQRGIEVGEIWSLLDELIASKSQGPRQLQPTAHIAFSFIREIDPAHPTEPTSREQILDDAEMVTAVSSVWQDIDVGDNLNVDLISDVVTSIARIVSDNKNTFFPLVALKKHDEYTFIHAINVAILTTAFSESLGFDSTSVHELCMAAILHDIGKFNMPKELLNKSERLTDEEFKLIQMHPVEGARLLLSTPRVSELLPIVAYEHHMALDGSGYPKVPKGWKPNLASRIIHITDVFDAMRTHRPYRQGMPAPQILEIMQKEVGTSFDSKLFDAFLQMVPRYNPDQPKNNG